MEKAIKYTLVVVLSTPIWLFMYNVLTPDVITDTRVEYIEVETTIDCAECIKVCEGTTFEESADKSVEIIIPIFDDTDHEKMEAEHPELWDNMKKYFVEEDNTPFKEAFKEARATLGSDEIFEWDGKYYTTNYVEETLLAKKEAK